MDIIFNCPRCEQELVVDSSGAGTEINCPSCGERIVIPQPAAPPGFVGVPGALTTPTGQPINPIASSAAAKMELHLKVPVRDKPAEPLIEKPKPPLEVAAKETDKKIRVRTIRHTDCIEVGHDKFDQVITEFLAKVGEDNIIGIHPLTYTHLDIGTQKLLTDYAVMIIYRG
jgi:DNA-directed RNA polymerase subunit RPC12/RpoP